MGAERENSVVGGRENQASGSTPMLHSNDTLSPKISIFFVSSFNSVVREDDENCAMEMEGRYNDITGRRENQSRLHKKERVLSLSLFSVGFIFSVEDLRALHRLEASLLCAT